MPILCTETDVELTGGVNMFAAGRDLDRVYCPLSESLIDSIPQSERSNERRSFKTGGVNIYRARIFGTNGNSYLGFVPDQDFLFSINTKTLTRLLPKTRERFPQKSDYSSVA